MKKNADGFVTGLSMALMADAELDEKDKLINSLRQQRTELKELIAELEAQQRWIPVSARLPEEKQEVIVINKYCYVSNWVYSKALINTFTDFTHWMPLPSLPEEK